MTAKQIDRALDILDRLVKVAEKWADSEYPERDENESEGYIGKVGEAPQKPQSVEEYKNFEPKVGRFEQKLRSET